ncbi:MAG: ATP-binding protein [Eubacteriales bacterium]|nr:ATP-binding protein [Eubacteriales bacterium]
MESKFYALRDSLSSLSVFRNFLDEEPIREFMGFLRTVPLSDNGLKLRHLGGFVAGIYAEGGNLTDYVLRFVKEDENPYLLMKAKKQPVPYAMEKCAERELAVLSDFAQMTPDDLKAVLSYKGEVPGWAVTEDVDIAAEYRKMIENIDSIGYGIFARYTSFKIKDGQIVPVIHKDEQSLDTLYGYARERKQVYDNTLALASGLPASNVLLYGDAGTGKSSTIKACANALADRGLRLIEFSKGQIRDIPDVIDQVYDTPLKFIFFIDDLSFQADDDDFCMMKGILEGNITGKSDNIAIYATSNRRHLVRELEEDRIGTDMHINDTLQQTMSLSARFGLTVIFSRPGKDLYDDIVDSLSDEYGISMDADELHKEAAAFAIRSGGRSPRTAKQFIQILKTKEETAKLEK